MRLLPAVALLVAPLAGAAAQYHPYDWVVQEQYRSALSGHELTVSPSQREGVGVAAYHASHEQKRVWAKELPFTLRHAHVGDDGTIAGWGWAARWWESEPGPDAFVALIAPDGTVRLHAPVNVGFAHARRSHVPTVAQLSGVTYDRERERLVARVLHGRNDDLVEQWLAFDASGDPSKPIELQPFANVASSALTDRNPASCASRSLGSVTITGSPLVLAAWLLVPIDAGETAVNPALVLAVLDSDAKPVWTCVRNASGAEDVRWRPLSDANDDWWTGPRVASNSNSPRRFAIFDAETRESALEHDVEPPLATGAPWTVRLRVPPPEELSALGAHPTFHSWSEFRASPPPSPNWEAEEAKLRGLAEKELQSLGVIRIPHASRVTLDARDRIHALCDESGELRALESDGTELWRAALPTDVWQPGNDCPSLSAHADGTVWIGYRTQHGGWRFARFTAPGRRLDDVTFGADASLVRVVAGADGARWRLEERGLFATDDNPSKLRSVELGYMRRWLWQPSAATFAHDGSFLIVVPPNEVSRRDHRWSGLNRYKTNGDSFDSSLDMPPWVADHTGAAFDGRCVVLAHDGSTLPQFPALVLFGDESSYHPVRLLWKGTPPRGSPFFAASGKELWIHDGATIERFESPATK